MQRLLADAEKLTGVKYDINNLSDVYSAIHAIQENLDITGTTAREAATTFTGSFESMKAAAQNVLGKISIGENVTPALQSLLETTKTFLFGNFLPMIGNILSGLGVVLTEGVSSLASQLFGDAFGSAVYDQIGRVTGIFQTFFDMIFGSMDKEGNFEILDALGFSEDAANQIINIADNIRVTFENIGSAIGNVGSIVADFVGGFLGIQDSGQNVNLLGTAFEFLSNVLKGASSILKDITGLLKEHPGIVSAVASAVIGLTTAWKTYKAVSLAIKTIESAKNAIFNISFALSQARAVASGTLTAALAAENAAAVGASGSFSLFNAVMSANPIVLVVGAIAALVAALAWFFTQTETGRQIWSSFVDWIKQAWQGISDFFVNIWSGISEGANTVWDGVVTGWSAVVTFFSDLWAGIQEAASVAWTAITTAVMAIVQPFIDGFMNIWNNISDGLTQVWEGIKMIFQGAWEFIKSIFLGAILIIIELVTGNFNQLGADLSLIWEGIKNGVSQIWEGIKTYFSGVVDVIVGYGKAAFENFSSTLSAIWKGLSAAGKAIFDGFAQILSNIWDTIKSVASSAWEGLKSTVLGLIDGLVQGAQRAWESMKQGVSDLVSNVTSIFDGIRNIDLWEAGKAILDGFLGGLKSAWGAVTDFVGGIASWIRDHKGPIEYDRKLLIPAGNAIMQGLGRGLQDRFKGVKKSVSGMAGEISNAFSNDDFGLSGTPTIAKNIEASLAMPSAQIEAKDSQTVSEIAILRASMEKILTAILEKPSDTYLDADKISMSVYKRQGSIYAREGI